MRHILPESCRQVKDNKVKRRNTLPSGALEKEVERDGRARYSAGVFCTPQGSHREVRANPRWYHEFFVLCSSRRGRFFIYRRKNNGNL